MTCRVCVIGMTVIVASNLKESTFPFLPEHRRFFLFNHLGPSSPFLTLIIVTGKKNSTVAHGTLISLQELKRSLFIPAVSFSIRKISVEKEGKGAVLVSQTPLAHSFIIYSLMKHLLDARFHAKKWGCSRGQRRLKMQISTMYDGSSYTGKLSVNESLEEGASQSV